MNHPKPIDAAALVVAVPLALGPEFRGRLWSRPGVNRIHVYVKQGRREVGVLIVGPRGVVFDPINLLPTENKDAILSSILSILQVKNPSAVAEATEGQDEGATPENPNRNQP